MAKDVNYPNFSIIINNLWNIPLCFVYRVFYVSQSPVEERKEQRGQDHDETWANLADLRE